MQRSLLQSPLLETPNNLGATVKTYYTPVKTPHSISTVRSIPLEQYTQPANERYISTMSTLTSNPNTFILRSPLHRTTLSTLTEVTKNLNNSLLPITDSHQVLRSPNVISHSTRKSPSRLPLFKHTPQTNSPPTSIRARNSPSKNNSSAFFPSSTNVLMTPSSAHRPRKHQSPEPKHAQDLQSLPQLSLQNTFSPFEHTEHSQNSKVAPATLSAPSSGRYSNNSVSYLSTTSTASQNRMQPYFERLSSQRPLVSFHVSSPTSRADSQSSPTLPSPESLAAIHPPATPNPHSPLLKPISHSSPSGLSLEQSSNVLSYPDHHRAPDTSTYLPSLSSATTANSSPTTIFSILPSSYTLISHTQNQRDSEYQANTPETKIHNDGHEEDRIEKENHALNQYTSTHNEFTEADTDKNEITHASPTTEIAKETTKESPTLQEPPQPQSSLRNHDLSHLHSPSSPSLFNPLHHSIPHEPQVLAKNSPSSEINNRANLEHPFSQMHSSDTSLFTSASNTDMPLPTLGISHSLPLPHSHSLHSKEPLQSEASQLSVSTAYTEGNELKQYENESISPREIQAQPTTVIPSNAENNSEHNHKIFPKHFMNHLRSPHSRAVVSVKSADSAASSSSSSAYPPSQLSTASSLPFNGSLSSLSFASALHSSPSISSSSASQPPLSSMPSSKRVIFNFPPPRNGEPLKITKEKEVYEAKQRRRLQRHAAHKKLHSDSADEESLTSEQDSEEEVSSLSSLTPCSFGTNASELERINSELDEEMPSLPSHTHTTTQHNVQFSSASHQSPLTLNDYPPSNLKDDIIPSSINSQSHTSQTNFITNVNHFINEEDIQQSIHTIQSDNEDDSSSNCDSKTFPELYADNIQKENSNVLHSSKTLDTTEQEHSIFGHSDSTEISSSLSSLTNSSPPTSSNMNTSSTFELPSSSSSSFSFPATTSSSIGTHSSASTASHASFSSSLLFNDSARRLMENIYGKERMAQYLADEEKNLLTHP